MEIDSVDGDYIELSDHHDRAPLTPKQRRANERIRAECMAMLHHSVQREFRKKHRK